MTKLTNKAEFIDEMMDSLRIAGFSDPDERLEWAERIWSRLVRRGLAEEPRERGYYSVVITAPNDGDDCIAYWDGRRWWEVTLWKEMHNTPAIIGPRIEEPKD